MKKYFIFALVACFAQSAFAAAPLDTYPDKTYPDSTYPTGTYPKGTYPDSTYPKGTYPKETYPDSTYPKGTYPKGTYPGKTYPKSTYPKTEKLGSALDEGLRQAAAQAEQSAKEQDPVLRILNESPRPVLPVFKRDGKVSLVSMREYFVSDPQNKVKYVGTYGVASCIAVVIISKKDGRVVSTALAHIDGLTLIEKSGSFFGPPISAGDELDIYLLASYGHEKTALKIIKYLSRILSFDQGKKRKVSYYVDLHGPNAVVLNTQTGELFAECPIESLDMSMEELTKHTNRIAMQVAFPSALNPSLPLRNFYKQRYEQEQAEGLSE